MYRMGQARRGPSFREAILMHAVARLVLHGFIDNIQASWVKMGEAGVAACLRAGVNDLGGTLMNESITRAAGSGHGQEWSPAFMEQQIEAAGRRPRMRTTLYADVSPQQRRVAMMAPPLAPVENAAAGKTERSKRIELESVQENLTPDDRSSAEPLRLVQDVTLYERVVLMAACN